MFIKSSRPHSKWIMLFGLFLFRISSDILPFRYSTFIFVWLSNFTRTLSIKDKTTKDTYASSRIWTREHTLNHLGSNCIQSVSKILGQTSGVSFLPQKNHTNVCQQTDFEVQPNNMLISVLKRLSVGTLKNSSVCRTNWKSRDTSPLQFLCLSKHSDLPDPFEIVPQSLVRCVHVCIDSSGRYFEHLFWELWRHKQSE